MRGKADAGNVTGAGTYRTKTGRRRRFDCDACGTGFSRNTGTPYYRLHASRSVFDRAAALAVEGVNVSAIARVVERSWSTAARWLERAQAAAAEFNERHIRGYELLEFQADELQAALPESLGGIWVFAGIEVSSRLWPATIVGRRTSKNTRRLFADVAGTAEYDKPPLITSDGFKYYPSAVRKTFGDYCVYGQVIKTRQKGGKKVRKRRRVSVQRRLVIGTDDALRKALDESEDSAKLNTSFIERLNLTIRGATAYLARRTPAYARLPETLAGALEPVRCHYNFLRPHMALRFGKVTRTPAMQAGLTTKRLRFRDIFMAAAAWP